LQEYSVGKPILIFCATRKGILKALEGFRLELKTNLLGVFGTAEQLLKEFTENEASKSKLPWSRPSQ